MLKMGRILQKAKWEGKATAGWKFESKSTPRMHEIAAKCGRETGYAELSGRFSLPIWRRQADVESAGRVLRPARFQGHDPVL